MASVPAEGALAFLFGRGKGSGAALVMFLLGLLGVIVCLGFGRILRRYHYMEGK